MEEPAEDEGVDLVMIVEEGVVFLELGRVVSDAVVGNDEVRLSQDVNPCSDGLTLTTLVIVLNNLTRVEILCDQTVNTGGIKAIGFNVVSEFHLPGFQT